tara:strand:- start:471 stop:1370 length:900 start_codon:yes stop_codon:yes gene_type:complete
MKIIFSLWTKPLTALNNTLGFNSLDDFFNSLVFSVNVAKRNYDNIHFYTDEYGLELIEPYKDQLPFTEIHCVLNEIDWVPVQWWAYPKMYVYSLQNEPFMHLDNDAYLWEPIPQKLINTHDFICQSYENFEEECHWFYYGGIEFYKDHIPKDIVDIETYHYAINAGIFGAFNEKGLKLFESQYNECYKSAKSILKDEEIVEFIDWDDLRNWDAFLWNVIMEQTYSYIYAIQNKFQILTLLSQDIKFTHLLAGSKRNPDVIKKVTKRVKDNNFEPLIKPLINLNDETIIKKDKKDNTKDI